MANETSRGAFVTAADVARHAGVSRSAVSRAFTPGASVSKGARARILKAADHLGYRVNRLAQSLNNARSNVIGLVGTDLQQPFHAELLATLSAALLADGFQCMLLNAANAERDMGCADRARARVSRLRDRRDDRHAALAHRQGMPRQRRAGDPGQQAAAGTRGRHGASPIMPPAADLAAEQLLAAGCRRLAVVSSAARTASLIGPPRRVPRAGGRRRRRRCASGRGADRLPQRAGTRRLHCSRSSRSTACSASPICSRSAFSTLRARNCGRRVPGRSVGDRLRRHSAGRLERLSAHDVSSAGRAIDRQP